MSGDEKFAGFVGLVAMVAGAAVRINRNSDMNGAELAGYVVGGILFSLAVAYGVRWLYVRKRGGEVAGGWLVLIGGVISLFAAAGSASSDS